MKIHYLLIISCLVSASTIVPASTPSCTSQSSWLNNPYAYYLSGAALGVCAMLCKHLWTSQLLAKPFTESDQNNIFDHIYSNNPRPKKFESFVGHNYKYVGGQDEQPVENKKDALWDRVHYPYSSTAKLYVRTIGSSATMGVFAAFCAQKLINRYKN